ncbi:uncharacterized mitochondrial protein-like protein [Tanacetum coccineum]
MRMKVLLGIHGVWNVVDPGLSDAKKNNIVKGLLFQSIPKDLDLQIGNLKIRKEMWEAIKTLNLRDDRVKEARLQTLVTEFENLKMSDNKTIDGYAAKLLSIAFKSTKKDVAGRLKAYEERVKEEDKSNDAQEKLLYARIDNSNIKNDSTGGRGRGSHSQGRGRGRGQTQEGAVNHEEGTFFMMNHVQETIFINEKKHTPPNTESNAEEDDVWYFDNDASKHMTGNYSYFSELNENITGLVSPEVTVHCPPATVHATVTNEQESDHEATPILLNNTLKEIGFQQCMQEKAIYRKVPNGEFIIVTVYVDDLFVTGKSLELINEFKNKMASQFEMLDLGELTYYLGIEVSQEKDCVKIKQERYAMKILKDAGTEDCNATLYPMDKDLMFSKAKDELEVEATQYRKVVAEFMTATAAACQAIRLRELLAEVTGLDRQKVIIRVDNKSTITLSKNPVFHGRKKTKSRSFDEGLSVHKVQGDEIVTWCARVTLFDSEIQGVIVGELI